MNLFGKGDKSQGRTTNINYPQGVVLPVLVRPKVVVSKYDFMSVSVKFISQM